MNFIQIQDLKKAMAKDFNIYENYSFENITFDFMGEFILKNEKYFLNKKNIVWGYENKEYVFVKEVDTVREKDIKNFILFSKKAMEKLVNPHENHMSTHLTLIFLYKEKEKNIEKIIKNIKVRRSYSWGLKGWSHLRIILFDVSKETFLFNKDSKEIINFYKGVLK